MKNVKGNHVILDLDDILPTSQEHYNIKASAHILVQKFRVQLRLHPMLYFI